MYCISSFVKNNKFIFYVVCINILFIIFIWVLSLSCNNLASIGDNDIPPHLASMKKMNVSWNALTDCPLAALQCATLESLDVSHNKITGWTFMFVKNFDHQVTGAKFVVRNKRKGSPKRMYSYFQNLTLKRWQLSQGLNGSWFWLATHCPPNSRRNWLPGKRNQPNSFSGLLTRRKSELQFPCFKIVMHRLIRWH